MLPDVANVQAEIRSQVSLNFKTPILDHAWASIVRCDEQYTTKGAAALIIRKTDKGIETFESKAFKDLKQKGMR